MQGSGRTERGRQRFGSGLTTCLPGGRLRTFPVFCKEPKKSAALDERSPPAAPPLAGEARLLVRLAPPARLRVADSFSFSGFSCETCSRKAWSSVMASDSFAGLALPVQAHTLRVQHLHICAFGHLGWCVSYGSGP